MEISKTRLEWLEYDLLEPYPHVMHGTFSRRGGVSPGRFSSLNVSSETGDHREHVKINQELVRKTIGVSKLIYPHQLHGVNVHRITTKNLEAVVPADALYTTEKNVGLGVMHADCQGAVLYDPVHEAVAVVHCGWKGNVQNVYARVIETLQREIGTQPHNLIVCISPSLGPDHAEFKNYKQEFPKDFWPFQKKPFHFDLWAVSRMQLLKAGILEKNIEVAEICNRCNIDDYYSHREEKDTGRNATVIALKP